MTDTTIRCQSCGMPLGTPGYYGTEADGAENKEYCKFCYQQGVFTQPDQTMEGMIQSSVQYTTKILEYTPERAEEMSRAVISTLKRWNS